MFFELLHQLVTTPTEFSVGNSHQTEILSKLGRMIDRIHRGVEEKAGVP
jgi:hypothetical protein